ncbi:MAG TPA: response regulator, partial [Jatrophihabitantaceae bacterium]|nr:response regulator [Jatrophihabitantaceae bacterium]
MATVLIVDDRPVNRDLVRTVLAYHGHETIEAATGTEALKLLRERPPDLVIADVVMPEMDGYELARAIRAEETTREIPVLFYTANYVEEEIGSIAAAVGVDRIVTKGGDLTELLEAVDNMLGTTAQNSDELMTVEEFSREHLRVLNAKLFEKVHELEEGARLHQMVEAIVAVGDDPSLSAILYRIATAAFSLVDARHTSVVIVASESRPADWVHIGGDETSRLRVEAWARNPAPVGARAFDFLVIPIRIGGDIFGNLVLQHSAGGAAFGPAETNLLQTLARAAGVAIANSQLYDDARRRQEWLTASAEVTSTMLGSNPTEASRLIAAGARRVIGATSSWICVPQDDKTIRVEAADGVLAETLRGVVLPVSEAGLFHEIAGSAQPILVTDAATDERTATTVARLGLDIGPILSVPLRASGQSFGVLYIADSPGRAPFGALDVEMARAFAGRAAQTLEFARAEEHRQRLNLVEDRNRIARDLHDVVIQRLFGVGLRLEQLRSQQPDSTAGPLGEVIDDLDRTIDEIRNTIFSLRSAGSESTSLRMRLLEIIEPATFLLTFPPRLRLEGPLDRAVPEHVHSHLLATVGEALSNAIRHAQASRVEVLVRVD